MPLPIRRTGVAAGLVLLALAAHTLAGEGMWPPARLPEHRWEDLRRRGLRLTPGEIWDGAGGGLAAAVVRLGGCTGVLVSDDGLIATNQHCAVRILQQHSTPDRNLLRDGFLAPRWADELIAGGQRVEVLRTISDVTARMGAPAAGGLEDRERYLARRRAAHLLEDECATRPGRRCQVVQEHGGLRWLRHEFLEIRDVRLVYAPPDGFASFGGNLDNWMWPRHAADFALLRAYVGPDGASTPPAAANRPWTPPRHLSLSRRGVRPGDGVVILGYPGSTSRWLPAAAVEHQMKFLYPRRLELLAGWIRVLEGAAQKSEATALAVAGTLRRLENRRKNLEGMLDGLRRWQVVEARRAAEASLRARAAAEPALAAEAGGVLDELETVYRPHQALARQELALELLETASPLFGFARTILVNATQRRLPDVERRDGYRERDQDRLRSRLAAADSELDPLASRAVTAWALRRALELDGPARLQELDEALAAAGGSNGPGAGGGAVDALVEQLHAGTRLDDLETRLSALGQTPNELRASGDSMLGLALRLAPVYAARAARQEERQGALQRLLPRYARLLMSGEREIYPDANGTLRASFATVMGYAPRESVWMASQTSLAGMLDKATGQAPFAVPAPVRAAAEELQPGRWRQASLDSVALCFLTDGDTTGGSSGSPVVDGRGRLVGLNFDRVYENIVGDYRYDRELSRNISVDIRAMLWTLEQVERAYSLLREMGVEPEAPKLRPASERMQVEIR